MIGFGPCRACLPTFYPKDVHTECVCVWSRYLSLNSASTRLLLRLSVCHLNSLHPLPPLPPLLLLLSFFLSVLSFLSFLIISFSLCLFLSFPLCPLCELWTTAVVNVSPDDTVIQALPFVGGVLLFGCCLPFPYVSGYMLRLHRLSTPALPHPRTAQVWTTVGSMTRR